MNEALTLLSVIGGLGAGAVLLLAWADRRYPASTGALVAAVDALLPQTQCAQCGYPGCRPYAQAVIDGAPLDLCPPGGPETALALSELLGRSAGAPPPPVEAPLAQIDESRCTGCGLCTPACPVDAIVGAAPFVHTVLTEQCTGCALCLPPCPVDCIELVPRPVVVAPRPVRIMARPRNRDPDAPEEACIRCGLCVPVCPEGLAPQELHWYTRDAAWDDAEAHGLDRCIECGLCNQACPSNIDLLTQFTRGRQALAERDREAAEAAEARLRFALRESRLTARAAARASRRESRLARAGQQPWLQ
jgi:electron transport complex protein RnfB